VKSRLVSALRGIFPSRVYRELILPLLPSRSRATYGMSEGFSVLYNQPSASLAANVCPHPLQEDAETQAALGEELYVDQHTIHAKKATLFTRPL
jgi:hypothetical protein